MKEMLFEELPIEIIDGDRGKNYPKSNDFFDKEYCLFLNTKNVTLEGFNFDSCCFITKEKDNILKKGKLLRNDIVLTTRGTLGNVALYSYDISYDNIRINSGMVILRCKKGINSKYLYSVLKSDLFKQQINQIKTGSAQPQLPISSIKKMRINLPPLPEQKAIAQTLSCLDEKIELNNKINKTLEEMAQAIFKKWFIDFDYPLTDDEIKQGGREFVDSELGKIPKGWKVGKLGDYCECLLGGTPSRNKEEYWNGNIPWINSSEINKFRIIKPTEYITELGLNKSSTKLLPKNTVVIAITGATLGQVSLLEIDSCANQSVVGIKENDIFKYTYLYPYFCKEINNLILNQTGGAQQHINNQNIKNCLIILPSIHIMEDYNNKLISVYEEIHIKELENEKLKEIRDTLLPKLINGEIRVPIK